MKLVFSTWRVFKKNKKNPWNLNNVTHELKYYFFLSSSNNEFLISSTLNYKSSPLLTRIPIACQLP